MTEEAAGGNESKDKGRWVNLIHETLIRSKGLDEKGKPQPYWPTLWRYTEDNKDRASRRERLQLQAREWRDRRGLARLFGLAGWMGLFGFRGLAAPGGIERRYLRWSAASVLVQALLLAVVLGVVGESIYWTRAHDLPLDATAIRWAHKLGKSPPLPKMEPIPDGQFKMGSESGDEDERPVHSVTFAEPFYLGATEVTFAQYDAFCEATGRDQPSKQDEGWGREDRPVVNVDWDDARAYAGWLGAMTGSACRLPSEAEWEYAARAGSTTEYALPAPDGSDDIAGKGLASCDGCGSEWDNDRTAPAGSFAPNAWGLYDMHGNVWEWVQDCDEGAPADRRAGLEENGGDCGVRVLRGGSWDYELDFARSAFRSGLFPGNRDYYVGFRVLCSSPILDH